jgi:hypothetical protein
MALFRFLPAADLHIDRPHKMEPKELAQISARHVLNIISTRIRTDRQEKLFPEQLLPAERQACS